MKKKYKEIFDYLDEVISNPICELNYKKDYELLIAIMLSAQTTDKRVNEVTKILFDKYNSLEKIKEADPNDIKEIVYPLGNYTKKAFNIQEIARTLLFSYNGKVPNDRNLIELLPGIGHKTANVFLSEYLNIPTIAVDTHVERVTKRLGLVENDAKVKEIEEILMENTPKERWSRTHLQLVLFGRYNCKSVKPDCNNCKLKNMCKFYQGK